MRFSVFTIVLIILVPAGCDETLPPRGEVKDFLEASYSVFEGHAIFVDTVASGIGGAFDIRIKNKYVEGLQEEERVRIEIDVWMRDQPEHRGVAVATARDLVNSRIVSGRFLTLLPDSAAKILKQWDYQTSDGHRFWEFVDLRQKFTQDGRPYLESDTIRFVASGKAQIFKNVQPEKLPQIEFKLVFQLF